MEGPRQDLVDDRRTPLTTATHRGEGAQGVKGPSPELAWPPQVGSYLIVRTCGREAENRHGILGTYSRDGEGDTPLLHASQRRVPLRGTLVSMHATAHRACWRYERSVRGSLRRGDDAHAMASCAYRCSRLSATSELGMANAMTRTAPPRGASGRVSCGCDG